MRIIVDFETSYTERAKPPHGLRHQTVPEYLHDERTQCKGAAVWVDGIAHYVTPEKLGGVLEKLAWLVAKGAVLSAHNATFDLSVWQRWFPDSYDHLLRVLQRYPTRLVDTEHLARYLSAQGVLPAHVRTSVASLGEYFGLEKGDTVAALEAGGQVLADYATRDAEIQAKVLDMAHQWPSNENALSTLHVLCGLQRPEALRVDAALLKPLTIETPQERELKKKLRQDAVMVQALKRLGVEPEYKTTKTGRQKLALSKTDDWAKALLKHENPQVRRLIEARLGAASNIERTRAQTFLTSSDNGRRALPLPLRYYAAHTGRSGGSDKMNVQNLPRGGLHRRALMAPEGYKLVACDASQIEVRVLAWLADDRVTLEVFEHGGDPYKAFAVDLYGLDSEDAVTKDQRQVAKSAVLGLGFGAGTQGFLNYCKIMGVEISENEAQRVVHAYRRARPAVPAYWQQIEHTVRSTGRHVLPSGRVMVYPEMTRDTFTRPVPFQKTKGEVSKLWHGLLTENAVQAAARDITLAEHAVEIGSRWPVVMMVHDEIVCCVPQDKAQECLHDMMQVMSTAPSWASLPLAAEGDIGNRYGELK